MVRKPEGSSGGNETRVTLSNTPRRSPKAHCKRKTVQTPNFSVKTAQKDYFILWTVKYTRVIQLNGIVKFLCRIW